MTGFDTPFTHVRTLHDVWESALERHAKEKCLGTRGGEPTSAPGAYAFNTFEDVGRERAALSAAFAAFGIRAGAKVGLYSINCPEWVSLESAMTRSSVVSVPLYDTLGPDAVKFICNHAELVAVACSTAVLPTMLECLPQCPTVKFIIVYGGRGAGSGPNSQSQAAAGSGARLVTFEECLEIGAKNPVPPTPPAPDALCTICYTSGTTGEPKGVMLTHRNLISNAAGYACDLDISPADCHISYLPLAHIYERVTMLVVLFNGASVGFFRGDVLGLLDDIAALKPTIFCSVPRLLNRIYDKVNAGVREGSVVTQKLFQWAYASKKQALERGQKPNAFFERLVFSKLRDKLGGRVRYMSTGSAPISPEVMEFLRICFGGIVFEGYGMTESACVISKTVASDFTTGHVGAPAPCCEIKLVDVKEMKYTARDVPYPRGEVCVRGPSVFVGYYKSKAQTDEVIDPDGWLHTGDIGTWLPGGRLKIIDRKKNIFKLAQGEYVAPEKIENIYARNKFVAQSFVYGDSLQAFLVAVVVPDEEVLVPWAKERGLMSSSSSSSSGKPTTTFAALCALPQVKQHLLKSMIHTGQEGGLKGFEQIRAVFVASEPFSVENGLITPTFKLKRPQALERYGKEIKAMYAEAARNQAM
jgi:long-chain acyl-CoA synthetase